MSVIGALVVALVLALSPAGDAASDDSAPPDTVAGNEFVPERNLSDCISALPQPDCGSDARSGWRQVLVLVAIVAGLVFIAWRIVRTARRSRRREEVHTDDA